MFAIARAVPFIVRVTDTGAFLFTPYLWEGHNST